MDEFSAMSEHERRECHERAGSASTFQRFNPSTSSEIRRLEAEYLDSVVSRERNYIQIVC